MQECLGRVLTLFNYPNNYERLVQATGKTNSKAAEKIILSLEQSVLELHALAEKAHTPIDRRDFEKVYLLNPITVAEYWVGTLKRKFSANFNHAKYEPISESANFIYAAFCYFEHDSIVNGNRDKLKVALHGFLRNLRKAKQFVEKSERDSLPRKRQNEVNIINQLVMQQFLAGSPSRRDRDALSERIQKRRQDPSHAPEVLELVPYDGRISIA